MPGDSATGGTRAHAKSILCALAFILSTLLLPFALAFAIALYATVARGQSRAPTAREIQSSLQQLPSRLVQPPSRFTEANADRAQPASAARTAPSVVIKMKDEAPMFEPQNVTITAGDTVEWKNNGIVDHSASDNVDRADSASDARLPEGAVPFASGSIMPGRAYRYTFKVPGTYRYFCDSHESDGMVGEITVKPGAHSARAETPTYNSSPHHSSTAVAHSLTTIAQDPPRDSN